MTNLGTNYSIVYLICSFAMYCYSKKNMTPKGSLVFFKNVGKMGYVKFVRCKILATVTHQNFKMMILYIKWKTRVWNELLYDDQIKLTMILL